MSREGESARNFPLTIHNLGKRQSKYDNESFECPTMRALVARILQCFSKRPFRIPRFGEFCSPSCLPLLPQLACSILPTTYKHLFRALYRVECRCVAGITRVKGAVAIRAEGFLGLYEISAALIPEARAIEFHVRGTSLSKT